ncbi:hypothetical protein [Micromonospora ureilytica]|uniref:hypothetical protein n=1 Tax=Micromonospora ureilytica TaxID=709868 RepID=UPI004039BDF0
MSDDVVELRVHGAASASAAQVLDVAEVEQVAGDRSGGFYRPRRQCSCSSGEAETARELIERLRQPMDSGPPPGDPSTGQ